MLGWTTAELAPKVTWQACIAPQRWKNQPQCNLTSIYIKVTFSWAETYFLKDFCIHICNHQSIKVVQFPGWTTILNRFCAKNAEPSSTIWSISNMSVNRDGSLVKLLRGSTECPITGLSNLVRSRKYGHQPTKDVDSALSSDESTRKTLPRNFHQV